MYVCLSLFASEDITQFEDGYQQKHNMVEKQQKLIQHLNN